MAFVKIPADHLFASGQEFFTVTGRTKAVLARGFTHECVPYVNFKIDGVMYVESVEEFRNSYFLKSQHDLEPGDVFYFDVEGFREINLIYVNDFKVIRFGSGGAGYSSRISQGSLKGYVERIADFDYSKIKRSLRNITDLGLEISK